MGLSEQQRNNLDETKILYPRFDTTPMPSKEDLLSRGSFGSVNDNRHINKMLQEMRK